MKRKLTTVWNNYAIEERKDLRRFLERDVYDLINRAIFEFENASHLLLSTGVEFDTSRLSSTKTIIYLKYNLVYKQEKLKAAFSAYEPLAPKVKKDKIKRVIKEYDAWISKCNDFWEKYILPNKNQMVDL